MNRRVLFPTSLLCLKVPIPMSRGFGFSLKATWLGVCVLFCSVFSLPIRCCKVLCSAGQMCEAWEPAELIPVGCAHLSLCEPMAWLYLGMPSI